MKTRRVPLTLGACLQTAVRAALLVCLLAGGLHAQTTRERFQKLTPPMKQWTLLHPFAAQKALVIGQRALALTDSMRSAGTVGTDYNGGRLDAYRHGIWMALLGREIGARKAASLGRAYERGNHWQFERGLLEDDALQDAIASEMDLRNNAVGIALGKGSSATGTALQQQIIAAIDAGQFWIIAKDDAGNARDAQGAVIPIAAWRGQWVNQRCLVPSDR